MMKCKIECGEIAKTIIGNISGMITAILYRFDRIQYEFSYFVNWEMKSLWMNENEFIITGKITDKKIGFSQND